MFALQNRGELPGVVELEFENLISRIRKLWLTEHNEDGTHKVTVTTTTTSSGGSADITTTGLSVLGRPDNVTDDAESITAAIDGQVLRRSGLTLGFGTIVTAGISNNSVTLAKLADIATLSVIGRSTAATGDPEVITAASSGQVLVRSGATLVFGAVDLTSANAISGNLPYANLPSGGGTWTANPSISGTLGVSGVATLGGNTYPTNTGTNDQVLTTNGSGSLSWTDKAGGGGGGITSLNSQTGATQTFTNDTNVIITSGGNAHVLGWSGQLGLTRGGTAASLTAAHGAVAYSTASAIGLTAAGSGGQMLLSNGAAAPLWVTPGALTKVNDTNVTLTLGGSATTALVNAASLTLGWTGQLSVARGGTGLATVPAGSGVYGNGTSALVTTTFKYVTPGTNTLSTAAAAMVTGDVLILDAGTYTQTTAIAIPAGVTDFSIIGQGQGTTKINYTTTDVDGITSSGIGLSDSYRILHCLLANFTMTYSVGAAASTKSAIQLWGYEYDLSAQLGIRICNVGIVYGSVSNCWLNAIRIVNARVAVIDQVYIRREANGRSGVGVLLESCMNCRIVNSFIMCTGKAVHMAKASDALISSAVKHGCEDITVTTTSCYIFGYGVYLDYKCFAAKILGVEFARPSSGSIYEDTSLGAGNGGYHFIDNCYHDHDSNMVGSHVMFILRPGTIMRGCTLNMADADTGNKRDINGITLSDSASLCNISSNLLRNAGGTAGAQGIWITTNANLIANNMFETSTGVGSDIYITGSTNAAVNNMLDTTLTDLGAGNTTTPNYTH